MVYVSILHTSICYEVIIKDFESTWTREIRWQKNEILNLFPYNLFFSKFLDKQSRKNRQEVKHSQ